VIKVFTEAGKGIGFGHLTRCSALVEQLKLQGKEVELIVYLNQCEINYSKFTKLDWLTKSPEELLTVGTIAVFDSYLVTKDWLNRAKALDCKLIHIDDYNRIVYPVDLIINPNVFAQDIDYSNQNAKFVGGADYVVIRAPFRNIKQEVRETNYLKLFITLGGSDYRGMLPKLAKWAQDFKHYKIRLVAPEESNICIPGLEVLPLLSAEEMVNEMKSADVVISACGQTLHELASINKPTIGICLDKDQVPNHKFYNDVGFIRGDLWWNQEGLQKNIEAELTRFSSYRERKKVADRLKELNPNGVVNVANAVLECYDEFRRKENSCSSSSS